MHPSRVFTALCAAGSLVAVHLAVASTIGPNVRIAASPDVIENEPQVAVSQGRMVAVFFQHYTGAFAYSADGGQTWSAEAMFSWGDFLEITGAPIVCADELGRFYAATSYAMVSAVPEIQTFAVYNGGFIGGQLSWNGPYVYAPQGAGDAYQRPSIACDRTGSHVYLAYTDHSAGFVIKFASSLDGGQTWTPPLTLSGTVCDGARVAVGPDGEVYVVWHDYTLEQVQGCKSTDFGVTFSPVFNAGPIHDKMSVNPPGWRAAARQFTPMTESQHTVLVNSPSIAIDRTAGPGRGTLYLAWSESGAGVVQPATQSSVCQPTRYYYQADTIQIGSDLSGYAPQVIPDCLTCPPSSSLCTFSGSAGTTFWLDAEASMQSDFTLLGGPDTLSLMSLASRIVYTNGTTRPVIWTLPTDVESYYLWSPHGTRSSDATWQMQLRQYVIDPSEAAQDERDVVLVSSSDGGQTWSNKVRVNDDPPRYDNAMPEVAVDSQGRVHVAWYDRREQPAGAQRVQTYWTWSSNGGLTFQPSQRVSEQISAMIDQYHAWYVGNHMCLLPVDNDVLVAWVLDTGADVGFPLYGGTDVMGARVSADVITAVVGPDLEAAAASDGVRVRWHVVDRRDIAGFRIHRAEGAGGAYLPLTGLIAPDHEGQYELLDSDVQAARQYHYRLEVLRADGTSNWYGPVEVEIPARVAPLRWMAVVPNPSAGSVRMTLSGASSTPIDVRVFDLIGHEVVRVYRGGLAGGVGSWTWDGRDREGRAAPPGIYVLWAGSGGKSITRRVTLLR